MRNTQLWGLITAVFLCVLAPQNIFGQEVLLTVNRTGNEMSLGRHVADCGDFDGDGRDDIVFVLSTIPNGQSIYRDTIRVISGDGLVIWNHHILGATVKAMAPMGDVNNDGKIDFAVLTTLDLRLISGATGAVIDAVATPAHNISSNNSERLANIGDLNADGIDDLAIGLPRGDSYGLTDNGFVAVLSGKNLAFLIQIDGEVSHKRLGSLVCPLGDVNGDGTIDFIIGRDKDIAIPNDVNTAYVISGSSGAVLATQSVESFAQSIAGTLQGFKLAGGADFDHDGVNDWVISASSGNYGGPHSGLIRVVSGATNAIIHDYIGQPCEGIGRSIALGDVNGDGTVDVISHNTSDTPVITKVGSVFSGLTKDAMSQGIANVDGVTLSVALGDVNGDGYKDYGFGRYLSNQILIISGGPSLSYTAKSMVGAKLGQAQDVLKINGSNGGQLHCVGFDLGDPVTMSIDQPWTNANPADFIIFGRVGVPMGNETYTVPGVQGAMTLVPKPMIGAAHPDAFTLTSSVGPIAGGQYFLSGPAPWSFTLTQGFVLPIEFTLEAVILEDATTVSKTNAIIVRVH